MQKILWAFAAGVGLSTPAVADEVWDTQWGRLAWETNIGETAVLRLEADEVVRFYVPGLARDMMGGRGTYRGLWTGESAEFECVAELVDPMGGKTAVWGTFEITFVRPEFPSDWAGTLGECVEDRLTPISGEAIYAQ